MKKSISLFLLLLGFSPLAFTDEDSIAKDKYCREHGDGIFRKFWYPDMSGKYSTCVFKGVIIDFDSFQNLVENKRLSKALLTFTRNSQRRSTPILT